MTQHNAALVEQTNAAIEQTEDQANELDQIVDIFVLDDNAHPAHSAAPAETAVPRNGSRGCRTKSSRPPKPISARVMLP
ncbi:MAG: hypothetical protein MO846_12555 [Candidatus Devosia symbiotica]|nr:hypothetical protein [Candidatus Devosia symbiotica]